VWCVFLWPCKGPLCRQWDVPTKFTDINNWFKVNLLTLNFEKTNFMQFITKNSSHIPFSVDSDINIKSNIIHIMF
jgi:hypothetical protein